MHTRATHSLVTEAGFLPSLLARFFRVLDSLGEEADALEADERQARVLYVERFVEFLIDLLSQLPTRRFFRPLLQVCVSLPQLACCCGPY